MFRTLILALSLLFTIQPAEARQQDLIRIVVPFAAGGTTDVTARILAEAINLHTGRPTVVENRPGGFAAVALEFVMRQPADGNTLFFSASGVTTQRHYLPDAVDPLSQLSVVSMITDSPLILLTSNRSNVPTNLQELVAYARQNPDTLNYHSVSRGGVPQMAADLFMKATGTRMTSIPYSGGATAVSDFVAGRLHVMFDSTAIGARTIGGGGVTPIAVTSPRRSRLFPDVPTFRELGYDIVMEPWQAVYVSAATPDSARQQLNAVIRQSLQNPAVVQRYLDMGMERVLGTTVEESETLLNREIAFWRNVFNR